MKKRASSKYLARGFCVLGIGILLVFFLIQTEGQPGNFIMQKIEEGSSKDSGQGSTDDRQETKAPTEASENTEQASENAEQASENAEQASENAEQASENTEQAFAEAAQQTVTEQQEAMQQSQTQQPVTEQAQMLTLSELQSMEAGTILDTYLLNQDLINSLFYSTDISETVQQRIWNVSYQENENIALADLRYLRVLYMGFDGQTHIGELIVNKAIEEDILEIMAELYANAYPIEKMVLVDEYGAEDEASMEDNNTSAFNYREIAGTSKLSKHSLGLAIDINPKYNPYVKKTGTGELLISPENGTEYADRSAEFPYKIEEKDLCSQLFLQHGFTWGGSWNSVKDYQHFEKNL